jgi:hypothetical protein
MPWLLVKGQRKMLVDFAVVIGISSVPKTWQNKQLPHVPLPTIITKIDPHKECYTH